MLGFVFSVVFIYLIYYFWIIFNFDKGGNIRSKRKKKKLLMPSEIEYFVLKYKIDLSKINYRYFLQFMGLVIAFDLAIVVSVINFIDMLLLQVVVGFVLVIIIVLLSFSIVGRYFKKKGLIKNE